MPWRGLDFVVTGTGRSGTLYSARLFTEAGLPCGHEDYFRYWPAWFERGQRREQPYAALREPYYRARESARRLRSPVVGDASWLAVPRLKHFRGAVFLQVRHPLQVVRGFVGNEFFTNPEEHGHYHGYATQFFGLTGDPVQDALRWWLDWNQRAERHADITYRLEDFDEARFASLLAHLDVDDAQGTAEAAFAAVPQNVNHAAANRWQKAELEWADIDDTETKRAAAALAKRYGYEVDTVIDLRSPAPQTEPAQATGD